MLFALQILATVPNADPFSFFQPTVTVAAADRAQLDRGEPVARVLPGRDLEVAIWAAVPVAIDGERLVAWVRRIEELKKSAYVLAIHRFSDPPRIEDLADLTLEDDDLAEILTCRPAHCGLKLSAAEMAALQRAAADAGTDRNAALQQRFRQIVLDRVNVYLAGGEVGPFDDHSAPVWPARRLAVVVDHSIFLGEHVPQLAERLREAARAPMAAVETFLYWSKERIADKPIVSVTDVHMLCSHAASVPDVLVAGKEIFSTHYINASLGVTALMRGEPGGSNYLVYVNRTEVDVLRGALGGIIRWFLQRRLKAEAGGVLDGLRQRLESGEPPSPRISR